MSEKFPKDNSDGSLQVGGVSDQVFEEMSGMVTLKRKGKEKGDSNHLGRITGDNENNRPQSP